MEQTNYHTGITTSASASAAFAAIANVSGWWAKNFRGNAQKTGDIFTVEFGETNVTFEITEVDPDRKIVWTVTGCNLHWQQDKTEWNGTRIVWEIIPENSDTKVEMTHIGLAPQVECYETCEKGWNHHIKDSLFKLVNEGMGMPV